MGRSQGCPGACGEHPAAVGEVCRADCCQFLFSANPILPPLPIRFGVMTSPVVVGDNIVENISDKRGVRILFRDFLSKIIQDIGG